MTLYEITGEYCALLEYADSTDEADEQVFLDTLESVRGELEVKADSYAAVITEINAEIEKFNAELKRLAARRDAMKNNVRRMKEMMLEAMEVMGVKEIPTQHFKLKVQGNGGPRPMEVDTDKVPDSFQKVIYEPDTDKIRKALENGEELPFARLKERGKHLSIK